ncbi:hypothetical protein GYMLUDRAFT_253519 [Collybiopsis luxurians FD-317 M1]|uniref:Uncharacterized protein n=1 Tax=Collybiopsis luxurians FD-317 M1 TaxID=944289 RepID=A0A0D0BWA8_9AGAR|nr:hypothetical protein GYMLUDRAFT_253519 [Collybiopsis luxurians FD-317 M1]
MATTGSRKSPRKPVPTEKSQLSSRKPSSKSVSPSKIKSAPPVKKLRAPQRCKQCPNYPLRSSLDCLHSKAYGALRKAVIAAGIECPERASAAELQNLFIQRNDRDVASCPGNTSSQTPKTPVQPAATEMMSSPINLGNRITSPDFFASRNSQMVPSPSVNMTRIVVDHNGAQYTQTIDPALLGPTGAPSSGNGDASSSPPPSSTRPPISALFSSPQTPRSIPQTPAMTIDTSASGVQKAVAEDPYGNISGLGGSENTSPPRFPRRREGSLRSF